MKHNLPEVDMSRVVGLSTAKEGETERGGGAPGGGRVRELELPFPSLPPLLWRAAAAATADMAGGGREMTEFRATCDSLRGGVGSRRKGAGLPRRR